MSIAVAFFALVGIPGSGTSPRSVEVKRLAPFAVLSGGVVLAIAN